MTTNHNTTSITPNVKTQEHIVTVNTAGDLRCDCQRFKVNVTLYGEGDCEHTAAIRLALAQRM